MKELFTVTFLVLGSTMIAQPTITLGNSAPMPGESFVFHYAPWQSEGPAGANQTWDFSNLVADSSNTHNYVDPATTPFGASFPTADVALEDPGSGVVYFDYSTGNMEYVGAEALGFLVTQTDPEIVLEMPCTYGTSWSDTQAGTLAFGTRSGSNTGDGDAYGTLQMPWGTVNNVLRVHFAQDYTDTVIVVINYDFDFYYFYKEGSHVPILTVADLNVLPSIGAPTNTKYIQFADQSVVGLGEEMEIIGSMQVYPSPASNQATLEFSLEQADEMFMSIFDMTGRAVSEVELGRTAPGIHREHIDLKGLTPGSYFVQLKGSKAQRTERLIVQ